MREPANHTAVIGSHAYTWVRVDEHPGPYGTWHALTDDPGWDDVMRRSPVIWPWDGVQRHAPLTVASPAASAIAVQRVQKARA